MVGNIDIEISNYVYSLIITDRKKFDFIFEFL